MSKLSIASKYSLLIYCVYFFIFPYCYFRHDDWLILGTAVKHLPKDWGLLWSASLYYSPKGPSVWFFRPVFKYLTYLNFHLFGYSYFLWLIEQLLLLWASLFIAAKSLFWVRKSSDDVDFFIAFFSFCIPLHFGSLVWVGEGMMNVPQVFFLSIALYGYLKPNSGAIGSILLSLFGFLGSLLCKESSVVFPSLLVILSLTQKTLKDDYKKIAAHAVLAALYLFVRFTFFEINPSYHPIFDYTHFFKPLAIFLTVCLLGPSVLLLSAGWRTPGETLKQIRWDCALLYLGFFFLLMLPHLGHWFFSPGWFFLPGFWLAWSFPLMLKDSSLFKSKILLSSALIFLISLTPLFFQLKRVGWQHWASVQRKTHKIIQELDPATTKRIFIEECENPEYPDSDLQRVVGSLDSVRHIWSLAHDGQIIVAHLSCRAETPKIEGTRVIRYQFPNVEVF